ncbi:hypothetical protein XENTR_v10000166 [Xenopus tropicalis]|nr:hypothetical protein XENTR_v10000166 [Xenopus tropicalis]
MQENKDMSYPFTPQPTPLGFNHCHVEVKNDTLCFSYSASYYGTKERHPVTLYCAPYYGSNMLNARVSGLA